MPDLYWRERIYLKHLYRWSRTLFPNRQIVGWNFRTALSRIISVLSPGESHYVSRSDYTTICKHIADFMAYQDTKLYDSYLESMKCGLEPRDELDSLFRQDWTTFHELKRLHDYLVPIMKRKSKRISYYKEAFDSVSAYVNEFSQLHTIVDDVLRRKVQ